MYIRYVHVGGVLLNKCILSILGIAVLLLFNLYWLFR